MRPAFSSIRSAAAFALLLLVLLALPAVVGKNLLPPREEAYNIQGWGWGPQPWFHEQIFRETNDIDIAIVGSSRILHAINPPYLQKKLSEKLGRLAVVRVFAWGGPGYDGVFFLTQDLLAHRRVRMLIFYDENPIHGRRNPALADWFRFGDNAGSLKGLPLADKGVFYFAAVIGMPRNLLSWLRPNLDAPLVSDQPNDWERSNATADPVTLLGAGYSELGYANKLNDLNGHAKFIPFIPATDVTPAAVEVYSPDRKEKFEFTGESLPEWQSHFACQFVALANEKHCRLAMLHLPTIDEARLPAIRERQCWPELMSGVTLLGIPPAKMFGGLTDEEVRKLYMDPGHFNKNGMDYFTALVTPALLTIYETSTNR